MKLVFSSVFESDFAELIAYFAGSADARVSIRFEHAIARMIELLLDHPEAGRVRSDLKPEGIRSFVVPEFRNYVLFYRIQGNDLVMLRVRFGGMNLPALFQTG